ncbi:MAG TPA: DUF4082 domain-containing protein [Candidatus Saccharimonadales bacterium]
MENEQKNSIQGMPGSLEGSTGTSLEQSDAGQLNQPVIQNGVSVQSEHPQSNTPESRFPRLRFARPWKIAVIVGLFLLVIGVGTAILINTRQGASTRVKAGDFKTQRVSFSDLKRAVSGIDGQQQITLNGQLQVNSSMVLRPTTPPVGAVAGQIYYDQATNQLAYYNGTQFLNLVNTTSNNTFLQNTTNISNVFSNITNATAGITTPAGTPGTLPKFTSTQTVGDSIVSDKGTYLNINGGLNLTASTTVSNLSFWPTTTVPPHPNEPDFNGPVEVGVKFTSDISGIVKGLRFYRGTTGTGPYTGSLWTSTGSLLAQATFTVTGTGWQEVSFSAPIAISPDTTYVASYHIAGGGGYAAEGAYFGATGVDNGPIHALASGIDGGNGVFNYGLSPTFPTRTFNSSNYWVDIVFSGNVLTPESRIRVNGAQLSSGDLVNDNNIAKRTSSQIFAGINTFRPVSDTAIGFSIQTANTTALFTVNTASRRIVIGPDNDFDGTLLVLGNKVTANDPAGVEGAIYYNGAQQLFRCFRNGTWDNCAQPEVDRSFSIYEEFLGGQNTSFASDSFGSLNWHAQAIGAHGSVDFDPISPAASGDRPGVLAVTTPGVANQGTTFLLGRGNGSMLLARHNIVKTAVGVSSTNTILRVGLHSQTTGSAQPLSGVWWEANTAVNPHWRYCSGDGTTITCSPSSVLVAADTWVRLELRVTGTGAGTSQYVAGINSLFYTGAATTIDTTNRVSPAFSCMAGTAATASCYWDYYQLKGTTSTGR